MKIATKSFAALYDGDRVTVHAGRTRVVDDHDLVARFPHNFRTDGEPRRSAASAPRRPGQAKAKVTPPHRRTTTTLLELYVGGPPLRGDTPAVLRAGTSPVTVRMSGRTLDTIEDELRATPGCETGGLLDGCRDSPTDLGVTRAHGPGPSATRGPDSLRLDWHADLRRARQRYEDTDRIIIPCGCWHTHPAGGPLEPSPEDLAVFGALFERADDIAPISCFVGLIVGPPAERWQRPRLAAWVTRRDDRGHVVCERAELKVRQ